MDGNDIIFNPIFVDTNLDTHLAIIVSDTVTVLQLKDKIVLEHLQCFPNIGEIRINALKVKRKGCFYHLSDSMLVHSAFDGLKKNWFLTIDVSKAEVGIPGLNLKLGIDNGNPSQKPDTKSDPGNNNPESLLLKSPTGVSDMGKNSRIEPSYIQKELEKPHPGLTDDVVNKGVPGRSLDGVMVGSLMSSRGWFSKSIDGEVTVDSGAGFVPENGVNPDILGVGIVKQGTSVEKKKRVKRSGNPEIRGEGTIIARPLSESPTDESVKECLNQGDTLEGSVAGVGTEQNTVLEMVQKESPELKNTGTVQPAKVKRKYVKRKADADPDQEPGMPKTVQRKGRKVTTKRPNIHVDSLPASTSLDQGLPPSGCDVSGKMEKTGTDPVTGSSDQVKAEVGTDDDNTHLAIDDKPATEIVNSFAGSRKAGKRKNLIHAAPKKSPIKNKGNKVGAQPRRVESVLTGDGENKSLTGYVHQNGAGDSPYLSNQTDSEKKKNDEEKEKSVIIPKSPDDRDDSGKSTKTQKSDKKVAHSVVEVPEKSGAVCELKASVDSSDVSRSSSSDSDSSEKTMSGNHGQSKAEGYRVVAREMEEAKGGKIVSGIPSGGLEPASNQSCDPLSRAGTGSPKRKEKKNIKKTIAGPPPLITEETSGVSDLNKGNVLSKIGEGKRRKVKPKNQDISDDIISAEPPVDRNVSPNSGIGSGKIEKMGNHPINGGSTERKNEPVPGDGIVHLTIDVKPKAEVEVSAVGSKKRGKKKTRQEKVVSLDHVDANDGHPPGGLTQKGGGDDLDSDSQAVLKKRRDDGEEKSKLENYVARNEYTHDVGITITESKNGVSNSNDNSKDLADAGVPESKEKKKYKKRKAELLPLITEDKSCVTTYPEKESVLSEAGDGKRRKAKPKKRNAPDNDIPPDDGDGKMEKSGTDDITGLSAERKPEPGLGDKISHLNIVGKYGSEFDKSLVGLKKGGKKKNLVFEDPKNTSKNMDPKNTPKNMDQKNSPKNKPIISDKGKKSVVLWREESVSTDESRKVTKTHGIKVSGSALVEPVKDGVDNSELSGSSNSDSDISEKTPTRGNGGLSNDYRVAARGAERGIPGEVAAGLNEEKSWVGIPSGGTHNPSYDSPSASSETTSTDSRDTPQQGIPRKEEREGSRDSSPRTPQKGNVKLEVILRSSARFKKMKVASHQIPDDDFVPDSQAVI